MPNTRFWNGAVLEDAVAGTGTTHESGWVDTYAQDTAGALPRTYVIINPLISTATVTDSTIELTLEGSDSRGDGGTVTLHRWVIQGGRNLVGAHLPTFLSPYWGPAFYRFLRLKAVVTGVSARFTTSVDVQYMDARPMTGVLYHHQLCSGVDASSTAELFDTFYVGHLSEYTVSVFNRGTSSNALTAAKFHVYAEEAHSTGSTYEHVFEDASTFGTLAVDAGAILHRSAEDQFIRIEEAAAGGTATIDAWIRGTRR